MIKTIIITGASSGIGFSLAHRLASLNHKIIAVGRNANTLEKLNLRYPHNVTIVIADINDQSARSKITEVLPKNAKGVYLVHNAGIASPRLIAEVSEEEWDQHYFTNIRSPLFLTELLLSNLRDGGRILNISTGLAHAPMLSMAAYGISKCALYMLKEYLNLEFNNQGILFGSAMPGVVDTPIQEKVRSIDSKRFPNVEVFKKFYEKGNLLNPLIVSKFLSWVLLDTNDQQFIKSEWDIYDESHRGKWTLSDTMKL